MDPLSEVLALLKPRNAMCGGIDAGGDWSIGFPAFEGIKCYAVVSGACWLVVEGVADPIRIETGDCFLIPDERTFCMTRDPALPPAGLKSIIAAPLYGAITTYLGGGDCIGVGGIFVLDSEHAHMLVGALPPVIHFRSENERAELRWALERMMREFREPRPGSSLVSQQLATMMLVQALRLYLAEAPPDRTGWLFALADKEMSAAMVLMHEDPARHWTLGEVAAGIGMSRSTFAQRFKAIVGTSPMEYLTRWRMLLAGDKLTTSDASISEIATSLGYESESAFGAAFKRVMNCSPRQYGRGANVAPPVWAAV